MTRRLSPIEMMIDRVTGYAPGAVPDRKFVKLECPQCGKRRSVPKDKTGPPNTARVVLECNECAGDEADRIIAYFDEEGRQIDADGAPIT